VAAFLSELNVLLLFCWCEIQLQMLWLLWLPIQRFINACLISSSTSSITTSRSCRLLLRGHCLLRPYLLLNSSRSTSTHHLSIDLLSINLSCSARMRESMTVLRIFKLRLVDEMETSVFEPPVELRHAYVLGPLLAVVVESHSFGEVRGVERALVLWRLLCLDLACG